MKRRSTAGSLLAAALCVCACSSGSSTRRRRARRPHLTLARAAPYTVAFAAERGGGDHRLAADVWRIALADLRLSGLFVGGAGDDSPLALVRIDRAPRRRADGSLAQGPKWKLRARVYAALVGQRRLLRSLVVDARRLRRAGHQLANLIYALHTQKRGPFLSRIAFVAPTAGTKGRQVFVVDYAGKGVLRVSRRGRHNILPAWSPGGDLIYTSYQHDNPDLYFLPRGESRARPIASYRGLNVGGAFSPDGRAIALTLTRTGNSDVHIIDRRGRLLRRLTRNAGIDASPTWSPDGRHIAFVSSRAGRPHIFVVASDGSGEPRQLTREGYENQEPRWCHEPGSRAIAYTSRGNRGFDIHVIDVQSGARRRLTDGPGDRKSPSWSPHCRHLVYSAGTSGLWIVALQGGAAPRQLYAAPAWTPAWSR